jgi:hypothetical protein
LRWVRSCRSDWGIIRKLSGGCVSQEWNLEITTPYTRDDLRYNLTFGKTNKD